MARGSTRSGAGDRADGQLRTLPRAPELDGSLALLKEGYTFISSRCDRLGSDGFRTRLLLRPVTCIRGAAAAELFYASGCFSRERAAPSSTVRLLQDFGSVQQLEGEQHRVRKQLFMELMTPAALDRGRAVFAAAFASALPAWETSGRIVLHPAIRKVLPVAAAEWAGVPLAPADVGRRSAEFSAMIDRAGSLGPANWWATRLRRRTAVWARDLVQRTREGVLQPAAGTALAAIAGHVDADGEPLNAEVAAVELLNILRPFVAIGRFITFAALALHQHPQWHEAIAAGEDDIIEPFVQEVRRFYPFFPVVGGRVSRPVTWRGHAFAAGDWVLLDLYGTNHDPRLWPAPEAFRPERFEGWRGNPFSLIPQGGGAFEGGHRCPGEWLTIELVKEAVRRLCRDVRYFVPMQDLSISLATIPALPRSGFVISEVTRR